MGTISRTIERNHDAIVRQWAGAAARAASARGLSGPELLNIIPKYLSSLVGLDANGRGERRALVENHLSARLREGFRLDEVVEEFALLERAIEASCVQGPRESEPDAREAARLVEEIQAATTAASEVYQEYLSKDAQSEKHFLRRLRNLIGSGSLEARDLPSLRPLLREVAELVMEAMSAQTAAIMLRDPGGTDRTLIASSGVAREALEPFVDAHGPEIFAAKTIVSEQRTAAIDDPQTTELEVNDALKLSGIHAVLGVRLPTRYTLAGATYVGLAEERAFTAREVRKLEVLGDALTFHLDNARLNAQLQAKVEELRREHEMRDRFVSLLAHDLRGPLSATKVRAQSLSRDAEHLGSHRAMPTQIAQSIDRVDRMIRDLLDVHRIRGGHGLALDLAECDLVQIARTAIEDLAAIHGARFVLRGDERVTGIWSADDVLRAIANLASNAIKYGAKDAPVEITVSDRHDGAEIAVHNEGAPIAAANRASLFEQFGQATSQVPGAPHHRHGWGLGLTLVRACAEAHGGTVDLRSAPGQGTTFVITLPRDARPFVEHAELRT